MKCTQCPVSCGADRQTAKGACGVQGLKIAKYGLFYFEEPPITYRCGSGCVFFCGCSLKCVFCQNFELSRVRRGKDISRRELADIFRSLEEEGAENINLVNPTHYLRDIIGAIELYKPKIPIVYNTHGYENIEDLRLASEFADIFLTDLKFIDDKLSARYTARPDYSKFALPAVEFMSQKKLILEDGKMLSGCIVRHLVLPLAVYDTLQVIKFVSRFNDEVIFSLMSQYTPFGEIVSFPELNRRITRREYNLAVEGVRGANLKNVFLQDYSSADGAYIPQWDY